MDIGNHPELQDLGSVDSIIGIKLPDEEETEIILRAMLEQIQSEGTTDAHAFHILGKSTEFRQALFGLYALYDETTAYELGSLRKGGMVLLEFIAQLETMRLQNDND